MKPPFLRARVLAVSHYLQALDVQRKANQAVAILGEVVSETCR